jgi:hypothetical protein
MKVLLGVFGPEETFGAAQRMFGPRAALGLGTAMLLVGGYFIPYLLAGFLARTRPIFNAVIGSMGPLVMFAGLTHALLDSTIAFAFASPFLAAFYCVGILGRRQIVMLKKMPNTPLERTHDD